MKWKIGDFITPREDLGKISVPYFRTYIPGDSPTVIEKGDVVKIASFSSYDGYCRVEGKREMFPLSWFRKLSTTELVLGRISGKLKIRG